MRKVGMSVTEEGYNLPKSAAKPCWQVSISGKTGIFGFSVDGGDCDWQINMFEWIIVSPGEDATGGEGHLLASW